MFITREEHPQLSRPWFTLHPCATSDWMKLSSLLRAAGRSVSQLSLILFAAVIIHAALVFFDLLVAVGGGRRVMVMLMRQEGDGGAGGEVGCGGEGEGQRQGQGRPLDEKPWQGGRSREELGGELGLLGWELSPLRRSQAHS
ncbi:unnamed protein product [Urochloa humidicola]